MAIFYVTMTWDDWPEGGSFGTFVVADDDDEALEKCREEMADTRSDGDKDYPASYYRENYGDEWHVVDCFEVEDWIVNANRCIADIKRQAQS